MKEYIYLISLLILCGCTKKSTTASVSDVEKNSIVSSETVLDSNGRSFTFDEIEQWDGVFLILSTACGDCLESFSKVNALSKANSKTKFVALLIDPFTSLEEYKKGIAYKYYGFLNDDWIVFSSEELINRLNQDYNFKEGRTPILFYRKDQKLIPIEEVIQSGEIKPFSN